MVDIIKENYEKIYELYKSIVCISSNSYDKEGINSVCDKIASFASDYGFEIEKEVNEKAGNELILTFNRNNEGPVIVFLAHLDTVHKKDAFANMFIEKEGKVYGPGVLDCKGGIAVSLLTAISLKQSGYVCPLRIVLVCDEEISMFLSGDKGIEFIKNNVRDASCVLTCESGTKDKIVVGRKGAARYRVTFKGISSHAGSDYAKGVSAIKATCLKIPEIESLSDTEGITYNCGMISGGKAPNIVPDSCEVIVDVRYLNKKQQEESERNLYRIMTEGNEKGISVEIESLSKRDAMEPTENNMKLFERVKSIADKLGYEDFAPIVPGGASDAAFPSVMGIPTLCGMGMTGKSQHTLNEEADISSLFERSHLLAETVLSIYKESL